MPRNKKTLTPNEEAANAKALDAAAGIVSQKKCELCGATDGHLVGCIAIPADQVIAANVLITTNTREKLLLKHASEKWTDGFFADFTDTAELAELTCRLGVRVLASIICSQDPEFADVKDKIAAMRVMLNIEYGENASMNPAKFIPPPPVATIPTGGTEGIDAAMAKMRQFGGKK